MRDIRRSLFLAHEYVSGPVCGGHVPALCMYGIYFMNLEYFLNISTKIK